MLRNDKGKTVSKNGRKLKDDSYGVVQPNGEIVIHWDLLYANPNVDEKGFDTKHREARGKYKITVSLPKGFVIIRYGAETGHFTAPEGTDYEQLSLPYVRDSIEFHRYRVIADGITVVCYVERGRVAPGFGSVGGGIQFYHKKNMLQCIRYKEIERISS